MKGLTGDVIGEIQPTAKDFLYSVLEVPHGIHLVEVTHGACSQASLGIELIAVGGVYQDLDIGVERDQGFDELKPILSNKLDLENQHVRLVVGHLFHGFLSCGAGPGDFPEVKFLDVVGKPDPTGGEAVHNRNACLARHLLCF